MPRSLFLLALLLISCVVTPATAADRPNILLIFIDDLGWKDVGCYGNDFVETPHIDALASRGMRFTDFYASGAVCSPTRCALQSGQNQARVGITAHIPGHWRPFERVITPQTTMALPTDIVTVAETLKTAGYRTGYVGKWHLGNAPLHSPDRQGYDFSAVIGGPHLPGRYRVQGRPDLKPKAGQYRTDFEADLCIDFMSRAADEPFFLMLSPYAVHIPLAAMSDKAEKYRAKAEREGRTLPHPIYAAMIEHVDDMVGRLVAAIDAQGQTDSTLIIFTSDNGGLYSRYDYREGEDDLVSSQKPLRGEKGSLHEGGVRIPMIATFPKRIPAGTTTAVPAVTHDLYRTFAALGGADLPANQTLDGVDLIPLLTGETQEIDREAIFWHYPHYHHDRPASSIRRGRWKLIEYLDGTNDVELFDLTADISESRNLAESKPGLRADLLKRLARWRTEVGARVPLPNPAYDPDRANEWWSRRSGTIIDGKYARRFPKTEKER